jgi:hypothetical protein
MPATMPANGDAPEATATPKHKGNATKKTTTLAGRSFFKDLNKEVLDFIELFNFLMS